MRKVLAGLALGALVVGNVQAATWYGFRARTPHSIYFFDLDSVTSQPGSVTLWIKWVNSEKWPDPDGSYSTASKNVYSCVKRTAQIMAVVTYDKDRNVIKTQSTPNGLLVDIPPGSLGEDILSAVCASNFPNLKSEFYVRVGGNDIYSAAKQIMDSEDDPAPK